MQMHCIQEFNIVTRICFQVSYCGKNQFHVQKFTIFFPETVEFWRENPSISNSIFGDQNKIFGIFWTKIDLLLQCPLLLIAL